MTDLIDQSFHLNRNIHFPKLIDLVYGQYNFQKYSLRQQRQLCGECSRIYHRFVKMRCNNYWNYKLQIIIEHALYQISTTIKIISPKGQILKFTSQYHKTYLYKKFAQKKSKFIGKINFRNGQISLCSVFSICSKLSKNAQTHKKIIQSLMLSIIKQEIRIIQIINLINNNQHDMQQKQINTQSQHKKLPLAKFVKLCAKSNSKQNIAPQIEQRPSAKRIEFKSRTVNDTIINVRTSSLNKVQQLIKYFNCPLDPQAQDYQNQTFSYQEFCFKKQIKDILFNVQNLMIRADRPLKNYQKIELSKKGNQKLQKSIKQMKKKKQLQTFCSIQKFGLGKLIVQIQLKRPSLILKTYHLLQRLPPQLQLTFINNYFASKNATEQQCNNDILIQLAIQRQQLIDYLECNSQCISFSTKLRILSQLVGLNHILESKYNLLMRKIGINSFSIAKNMMIKLNDPHYLKTFSIEEKSLLQGPFKNHFIQNQIDITKIYSKLFYQKELIQIKAIKNTSKTRFSHSLRNSKFQNNDLIVDQIYEESGMYGPKNIMALLSSIFISYIPRNSIQDSAPKDLKWGIASVVKILQNVN